VESVSWWDVAAFLDLMTEQNPGEVFRLPTEAEWENACRADGDGRYGDALDTLRVAAANFDPSIPFEVIAGAEGPDSPMPVGSFEPNSWGFYDLVGNVWEWVADEYCPYPTGSVRNPVQSCGTDTIPIRGGSWHFSASAARCGRRYTHHRDDSGFSIGFRVVREVPGPRETT
jgi:formylglycine-generating enzyme required for sulfatase activity